MEAEGRALAPFALDRHVAAVRLDDRAGDKQAQPGATDVHRALVEKASEFVEELGNVLGPDADPLVMDGHLRLPLFGGRGDDRDVPASGRILDGVIQKIEERLLQATAVAADDEAPLDPDPHRIATRVNRKQSDRLLYQVRQVDA